MLTRIINELEKYEGIKENIGMMKSSDEKDELSKKEWKHQKKLWKYIKLKI